MRSPRRTAFQLLAVPAVLAFVAAPAAAVLPPPDFETGQETPGGAAPPRRYRVVQGDDFAGRLALTLADVKRRCPAHGFWVGYSFEPRPGSRPELARDDVPQTGDRPAAAIFVLYGRTGAVERVETDALAARSDDGRPAYWLGRVPNGESVGHLRRLLEDVPPSDPDSIGPALAGAIGLHGGPRAASSLRDLARLSPLPEVRGSAAISLLRVPGQIGFVSGVVLDRRESVTIRQRVAAEMGRLGGAEATRALLEMAAVVREEPLRQAILAAARGRGQDEARLRTGARP